MIALNRRREGSNAMARDVNFPQVEAATISQPLLPRHGKGSVSQRESLSRRDTDRNDREEAATAGEASLCSHARVTADHKDNSAKGDRPRLLTLKVKVRTVKSDGPT